MNPSVTLAGKFVALARYSVMASTLEGNDMSERQTKSVLFRCVVEHAPYVAVISNTGSADATGAVAELMLPLGNIRMLLRLELFAVHPPLRMPVSASTVIEPVARMTGNTRWR